MGQNKRVRTAARAVVENMEPRRLMSVTLGPAPDDLSTYGGISAGGGDRQQVGADAQGNTLYVWEGSDGFDLMGRWFDRNGAAKTGELTLARRAGTNTHDVYAPRVDVNATGKAVLVWGDNTGNNGTIRAKVIDGPNGSLDTPVLTVGTGGFGNANATVTISDTGSFAVAWEQAESWSDHVRVQRFTASGAKATKSAVQISAKGVGVRTPSIDMDASGNYVVAWGSGEGGSVGLEIRAKAFNAGGTQIGGTLNVNELTAGNQTNPHVSMGKAGANGSLGSFVIGYGTENSTALGFTAGYVRPYLSVNAAQPAVELVKQSTGYARLVSVDADADGTFVAAWNSFNRVVTTDNTANTTTTATTYEVKAQRFTGTGAALDTQQRVTGVTYTEVTDGTTTTNTQNGVFSLAMEVVSFGDGQALITYVEDPSNPTPDNPNLVTDDVRAGTILTL